MVDDKVKCFSDQNNIIDVDSLLSDYPEVAEMYMFRGLEQYFFNIIEGVRRQADGDETDQKDYSKEIEEFNRLVEKVDEFEASFKGGGKLFSVVGLMSSAINKENLSDVLKRMNLMEYYRFTGEIRKNFWEFKNNLYNGLSNEDRLVDSIIVSRLDPPCSKPTHKLPDFRLDIDFSENGVLVNGKKVSEEFSDIYGKRNELFEKLDIDKVLKEKMGITNPIQVLLAKRKIDPAVLYAISEVDTVSPVLQILNGRFSRIQKGVSEEAKTEALYKYMSSVLGKEVEDNGENKVSVVYNANGIDDVNFKRYARRAKGKKGFLVIGDVRSKLQLLRDKIFGTKLDKAEVEVLSEEDAKKYAGMFRDARERGESVVDTNDLVQKVNLNFQVLNVPVNNDEIQDDGQDKPQKPSGEEK